MSETKSTLIKINDVIYDISNFKHPGGSILNQFVNTDATSSFNEFHFRSKKAHKILNSLPKVNSSTGEVFFENKELREDFKKLRKTIVDSGYFKPSFMHVYYRLGEVSLMYLLGVWCMFHLNYWGNLGFIAAAFILGITDGRCGWLMHEAGHYSLTGDIKTDRTIQTITYGLGCGMSGSYWRNQHNKHHASPQKINHDVDLDTLPLVAFHKNIKHKIHPKNKLMLAWINYQAYFFAPVSTTLVVLFWQFYLHPRFCLRRKLYNELAVSLPIRLVLFYGLVSFANIENIFLFYLMKTTVAANYIFVNFAVSHTHRDIVDKDKHVDWVVYASSHTSNVEPSWWCNWWMSYLNFQIEHHLFPSLPQFNAPLIAPLVKSFFKKHNLVYDSHSYVYALKITFHNLYLVSKS